ncbi:ClpX C4-type zinc finger protein [Streptomyces sp. bgisy027]|uniref:ClpX C4-type zinc finger protein n=1 Tax=unclassified Streptomyces TaxID=2593676 RepID=UPI003D7159C4
MGPLRCAGPTGVCVRWPDRRGGPARRRCAPPRRPSGLGPPTALEVIATNLGSRARRVLNDLGVDVADIKRRLHTTSVSPALPSAGGPVANAARTTSLLAAPSAANRKARSAGLVSGPDVWICADCVVLCGEILAQPAGVGST